MPSSLSRFVLAIDVVFSYLYVNNHIIIYIEVSNIHSSWLTAFIFAAQDYSGSQCFSAIPAGLGCKRKRANEAFIFLALYVARILPPAVN